MRERRRVKNERERAEKERKRKKGMKEKVTEGITELERE